MCLNRIRNSRDWQELKNGDWRFLVAFLIFEVISVKTSYSCGVMDFKDVVKYIVLCNVLPFVVLVIGIPENRIIGKP